MIKERDYLWDNIKALLICLVVTGHCIEVSAVHHSLTRAVNYWIYSFHMPLFFFLAGMSIKPKALKSFREWRIFIRKN